MKTTQRKRACPEVVGQYRCTDHQGTVFGRTSAISARLLDAFFSISASLNLLVVSFIASKRRS
jgi:hypothetical protein